MWGCLLDNLTFTLRMFLVLLPQVSGPFPPLLLPPKQNSKTKGDSSEVAREVDQRESCFLGPLPPPSGMQLNGAGTTFVALGAGLHMGLLGPCHPSAVGHMACFQVLSGSSRPRP